MICNLIMRFSIVFCLFVTLFVALSAAIDATFYPANRTENFSYTGRWQQLEDDGVVRSDWPCSRVQFNLNVTAKDASIALRVKIHRVRLNVVVTNTATGDIENSTILEGNSFLPDKDKYDMVIENTGIHTVTLTKLTQAAPYGNGVGKAIKSVLEFIGVEIMDESFATLSTPPELPVRRIGFIGASDTAGYCVDGTLETTDFRLNPWKYDNCEMANPGVLGKRLDAEVSVQAIAGIGVTQNAFADQPALLGELTMPDYYNRTLQTETQPFWNFEEWRPDLVIVSLGGNDYNHQEEIPPNETFIQAYEEFLLDIAEPYTNDTMPTIVSICGQGDPTEVERDPNNDRCRPCPHVQDAVDSFQAKYNETIPTEYIFIPCDGTVVTGDGDIGCDGHKNQLGQERVADFLEPKLREIMDWPSEGSTEPTTAPSSGGVAMTMRWLLQKLFTGVGLLASL